MTKPRVPPKVWRKVSVCCPSCGQNVFALKLGDQNVFLKLACGHCTFRYDIQRDLAKTNPNQEGMPLHLFTEFLVQARAVCERLDR